MFNADNALLGTVRSSAILVNGSYVAGTVLTDATHKIKRFNQLILYVDFTKGSLTTAEIKVEFSNDGVDYYQETFDLVTAGVSTESLGVRQFSATGKYRIQIPINEDYIKVSAQGTGTVTNSLMAIKAIGALT